MCKGLGGVSYIDLTKKNKKDTLNKFHKNINNDAQFYMEKLLKTFS